MRRGVRLSMPHAKRTIVVSGAGLGGSGSQSGRSAFDGAVTALDLVDLAARTPDIPFPRSVNATTHRLAKCLALSTISFRRTSTNSPRHASRMRSSHVQLTFPQVAPKAVLTNCLLWAGVAFVTIIGFNILRPKVSRTFRIPGAG